jgi:hypothetical protein
MDSTLAQWMATIDEAIPTVADVISSSADAYDQIFGPVEQPGGVGPTIANEPKPLPQAVATVKPAASGNMGLVVVGAVVLALWLGPKLLR